MRLIFAGTPEFARTALERLHAAGHDIALVLTQPDRPSGRGMKLQPSAVKQFALDIGAPVAQPTSLRMDGKHAQEAAQAREQILAARADAMVVAAYGLILPQWVLDAMRAVGPDGLPGLGCINIHASLLPRWRGAAPIHRAIEAGDTQTGVTIMQMDAGLDTGDMLLVQALPLAPDDTTASLHDRLADLGGALIVQALADARHLVARPQPSEGVSYAHKIEKQEAALDWNLPAEVLERRVRAFHPFPGAACVCRGEPIKVWAAALASQSPGQSGRTEAPGTVLAVGAAGIDVATAQGALRLKTLQRAGGRRMDAADFLRGFPLAEGDVMDRPAASGTAG